MKSYMASPSDVERKWYVVDAEGKTLGRLASEIANVLRINQSTPLILIQVIMLSL